MDRSAVREIVQAHAEALMERLGLPHWTVEFLYDLRLSTADRRVKGRCTRLIDYNRAVVELDPDEFDDGDEKEVLRIVRHELFHVVLSPFDLFRQVAEGTWDRDPDKQAMMDRVWSHAAEQAVINLERMYRGLTTKPKETPPMGRQKPKPADATPKATAKKAAPKKMPAKKPKAK